MDRFYEEHLDKGGSKDGFEDVLNILQPLDDGPAPITKLPHLDIFAHGPDSCLPLSRVANSLHRFSVRCNSNFSHSNRVPSRHAAASKFLRRYVRFIIGLTGQNMISIWCDITTALRSWHGIIVGEQESDSGRQYCFRGLQRGISSTRPAVDVTDFSYHFGPVEDWEERNSGDGFSFTTPCGAELDVKFMACNMFRAAVESLMDQIRSHLAGDANTTKKLSVEKMSILNAQIECQPRPGVLSSAANCLHEMFELQATKTPDRCAIEFLHPERPRESSERLQSLSYRELDDRCNSLAEKLQKTLDARNSQYSQNRIVPVFISTSAELYMSYLGILKAGHAFCPLPTDAPSRRLRDILNDIQPSVVLGIGSPTENKIWLDASSSFNFTWIDVQRCVQRGFTKPTPHLTPAHQAYLIYTSGSTGKAKGIQVTHGAATASIVAHIEQYKKTMPHYIPMRWYQFAAPTFDPSIMEIFVTLCSGGTLCSAPREMTLSSPEVAITETRSTIMMATSGFASMLDTDRLPTLFCLWTMGEALSHNVISGFAQSDPPSSKTLATKESFRPSMRLCNAYGPTEAAINVTFFPNVPKNARGSIIGYPLGASLVLVIEPVVAKIEPVPLGFVGELVVAGRQVSCGYLQRPRESSTSFVEDERYGRLYRTGDRARVVWDMKGKPILEFLGRLSDDQVKINGQRVELGEIENVLCAVPEVRSAVAVVETPNQNNGHGASVIAGLVLEPTLKLSRESIEGRCKEIIALKLPSHMQPARYIYVHELPRTSAGKVDRKEMSRIASTPYAPRQKYKVPRRRQEGNLDSSECVSGDAEQRSAQILRSLEIALLKTLGASGSAAGYLRYGLDSLSALRFLGKIKEEGFDVVSLKDVLHARSVKDLAQIVSSRTKEQQLSVDSKRLCISPHLKGRLEDFRARWTLAAQRNLNIAAKDVQDILPTTATQARILLSFSKPSFHSTRQNNYVHHSIHTVNQETDINELKVIWHKVLKRHDIYRTLFIAVDDGLSPFAQIILSPDSPLSQIRWIEKPSTAVGTTSAVWEAERMITLENPTPVLTVMKTPNSVSVLLSMIHAMIDLSSLQLLLAELGAERFGKQPLYRRELRYAVEAHFASQDTRTNVFWNDYLIGYEPLPFPSLNRVRSEMTKGSTSISQISSKLAMDMFEERSRNLLCSPLSALQGAWSAILLAYTSSTSHDVAFGTVFSDRSEGGGDVCVAPTFSVIPTLTRSDDTSLNIDILRTLTTGNSRANGHLHSSVSRESSHSRLYDTTIALQVFQENDDCKDLWQDTVILPMAHDYAVMVEASPDEEGQISLKASYTDTYLDQKSAEMMLSQLDEILIWILANPTLPFRDALNCLKTDKLSILNPNPTTPPATKSSLLHTKFEINAREHPDRTALEYYYSLKDMPGRLRRWSYKDLDDRANKLAKSIRSKHMDVTGTIVPILMDKQPELYLAVLGVLKSGAAWSPVDISSPAKRRRALIARLHAKLILIPEEASVDRDGIPEDVEIMMVRLNKGGEDDHSKEKPYYGQSATPNSMAYLIWTSGTTGAPKGVSISHRAACMSMNALQANIHCKTKSGGPARCLQFSQHTFDVFLQDLFFTWGVGGTVISASRDIMTNSFAELSCSAKASHAHLTPAFAATVKRGSCPYLEVVTMIGEKLHQHVADDWGRNLKSYNTYGPAEATVVSTLGEFSGAGKRMKSSNIGKPLPSVSCYVLRDGKEVMIQGVGELALGGSQLAEGYLNDLERTRTKFVNYTGPERKLYLTGDVVRQLADGTLDYIGREDDLVKLGGIRVELSEISYNMKDCHELTRQIETCYLSRRDRPGKNVVSFIAANVESETIGRGQPVCTTKSVEIARCAMRQAQQSLPNFMIPSTIVILQQIPNTSSAKVDRKSLQKVYEDLDLGSWEAATRTDQLEESEELSADGLKIRQCLSNLSTAPLQTIHLHSSLNSLGIDSIVAARFAQRLTDFDLSLTIADILQSRTVKDLLSVLKNKDTRSVTQNDHESPATEFSMAWLAHVNLCLNLEATFVMPATPMQEGVLSESMLSKMSYWSSHFFELNPSVTTDRLQLAWELVCRETEALRTCFSTLTEVARTDKMPPCPSSFIQIVLDKVKLDWAEHVAESDVQSGARERVERIATYHQDTAFHQPPWAVTIIKAADTRYMILTIHHAIHDADSIKFLLGDLASAYQTLTPPMRHQMRDALPACMGCEGRETDETFWQAVLKPYADIETPTWPNLIGTDESFTEKKSRSMISDQVELKMDLGKVALAARSLGISFAVIIKVAFGCLLLDYLETPAIVFGEVLSQRYRSLKCRDAVAPLVATVPVPLTAKQNAMELLADQTSQAAELRSHGVPSAPFVRKLLRRDPKQILYPAVFVLHPPEERVEDEQDLQVGLWRPKEDHLGLSVEHDLALNVYSHNGWTLEVTVKDHLMNRNCLKMFCSQIEALTRAILKSPNQPLLGMLDNVDQGILSIFESRLPKSEEHPCNNNPIYWLQYHAQLSPDWNAVEIATNIGLGNTEIECWSFETLFRESCKVANFIRERAYSGGIIAVCAGKTLQSYALIVGILMSSNTYLPIDDSLPLQRKLLLLEDSNCTLLLTDSSCITAFGNATLTCCVLNFDDPSVLQEIRRAPATACLPPNPRDSAYLLYTSGSTGKPKGVIISHRSLCGFIEGLTSFMGQCSTLAKSQAGVGKWLGLASRAFDVHLAEMFLAWRSGLTTVTAPRELLLDDLRLALTSLKVTHACFVPSLLEQAELKPDQIPDFVFMTVGGEKLSKRIIETFAGHPRITAVNAYGPTELAIGCSASHIVPNLNVSNIGFPFGNTTAHILVPGTLHYTKKGQAGELCFTGCLVGNGYLNRPDVKGFVEDFHGHRMYRTGDMARMLADGSLAYLGRSDDQTKLRGQRMELSEISESIRSSHKDVLEVVTLFVDHSELSSTFLTSFVSDVVERTKRYDARPALVDDRLGGFRTEIYDHCKRSLPPYMIPDYVIPVNIIPLAKTSGKADIKTLKAFFASLSLPKLLGNVSGKSPDTSERVLSELEQRVASIVKRTLELYDGYKVKPNASLFALGLDSLNAVGLMVNLREVGLQCTLALLLGNPTVEAIASCSSWGSTNTSNGLRLLDESVFLSLREEIFRHSDLRTWKDRIEKILPCLPVQENTIVATLNSKTSRSYIGKFDFDLSREIDLHRFKQAWIHLQEAQPILRTSFFNYQDSFVQLVLRPHAISLPWTESLVDQEAPAQDLPSDLLNEIHHTISDSIQERPLWRLHLTQTTGGRRVFSLAIHHALYDAQSLDMMIGELWLRYKDQSVPERTTLEGILEYRLAQNVALQKSFWKQYLAGARVTRINDNVIMDDNSSVSVNRSLKMSLSKMRHCAKELEITLPTLMQCSFALIFARRMKRSDVLFGTVLSGRSVPVQGAESIIAPCITTIPQRMQYKSDNTLSQHISQTQDTIARCMEHQHTSLRDISRWVNLEHPMFEALFSFSSENAAKQGTLPWTQLNGSMFTGYPLAIEVTADNAANAISVNCEYTDAFGTEKDARDFIEDMNLLLTMVYNGENPTISSLGLGEQAVTRKADAELWDETSWSTQEYAIKDMLQVFKEIEPKSITKNASFFQLGIDSISAIRLAKSLQKIGLGVSSADILRHSTIGSLGHYLLSQSRNPPHTASSNNTSDRARFLALVEHDMNLTSDSIEATYYCTPLQAGMITATLASNGNAYIHQHVRALPAGIAVEKLREAWTMTVQSLDILKTSFHFTKGKQWVACVHRRTNAVLLDCGNASLPSLSQKPIELLKEEDFSKPPHYANLTHIGKKSIFRLTLHHALYDGVSLPMIFDRLFIALQGGRFEGLQSSFYRAAHLIEKQATQSRDFWLATLKGYRNFGVHELSNHPPRQISSTRKCRMSSEDALEKCKTLKVTLQSVLLTAYSKVLAVLFGRRDVAFGQVVSGRSLPIEDCESIIGPLFNTIPHRQRFDHLLFSNQDVTNGVLDFTTRAHDHQHASLAQIQHEWRKMEGCDGARLFDCLFLFQKVASPIHGDPARHMKGESQPQVTEYCLNIEFEQHETECILSASRHEGCLKHMSLDNCLDMYEEAIWDILESPARAVGSHPVGLSELPLETPWAEMVQPLIHDGEPGEDPNLLCIKAVLAKVSGIPQDKIASTASIFALGLTSLSAINVAAEYRRQGLNMSVADVLQGVTARGIYDRMFGKREHENENKKAIIHINFHDLLNPPVKEESIEHIHPALSGQTYHLAGWLKSGRTMYMPTWSYTCPRLDLRRFQAAWDAVWERHPILRTTFAALNSTTAAQLILRPSLVAKTPFKCDHGSVDPQSVQEYIRAEQRQGTDMRTPPIRLQIIRGLSHDIMLLTLHHALYDARSLPIILCDLAKLYSGTMLKAPPDWVGFVEKSATDLQSQNGSEFWRRALGSFSKTIIFPRRPPTNEKSTALPTQSFISLPKILNNVPDLSLCCRDYNVSLPTLLLLSFARSLASLTKATNPMFGLFSLGRSASVPQISQIAGPCLNMLPHVVRSPWEEPWYSRAQEVQKVLADRITFEQTALPDVLGCIRGTGEGEPKFNTYVNILWRDGDVGFVDEMLGDNGMFKPIDVGVPSDFTPEQGFKRETSLEELNWPVTDSGVYVDIVLSRDGKSVDIGARIEHEIIGKEEARVWLTGIGTEVRKMLGGRV